MIYILSTKVHHLVPYQANNVCGYIVFVRHVIIVCGNVLVVKPNTLRDGDKREVDGANQKWRNEMKAAAERRRSTVLFHFVFHSRCLCVYFPGSFFFNIRLKRMRATRVELSHQRRIFFYIHEMYPVW